MTTQAQPVKTVTDQASVTAQLCAFVDNLAFAKLPAEVVHKAKMCLLDYLGTTYSAHEEKPARILVDFVTEAGGRAESTILGFGLRTSSMLASLVNGSMGHMMEMDDTHCWTMAHVGDGVIAETVNVLSSKLMSRQVAFASLGACQTNPTLQNQRPTRRSERYSRRWKAVHQNDRRLFALILSYVDAVFTS